MAFGLKGWALQIPPSNPIISQIPPLLFAKQAILAHRIINSKNAQIPLPNLSSTHTLSVRGVLDDLVAAVKGEVVRATHGPPDRVTRVIQLPPVEVKENDVCVKMLAAPINPSDINRIEGLIL